MPRQRQIRGSRGVPEQDSSTCLVLLTFWPDKYQLAMKIMTAVPAVEASAETLRDILTSTRDEVRAMKGALTDLASVLTAASADLAPVLTAFTDEVRAMRGALRPPQRWLAPHRGAGV